MGKHDDMFKMMIKGTKAFIIEAPDGSTKSFTFKTLPFEYLPDIMYVFGKMTSLAVDPALKEEVNPLAQMQKFMKTMDKEAVDISSDLCRVMVRQSYDLEPKLLDQFVADHFLTLFMALMDLNTPVMSEETVEDLKKNAQVDA